MTHRQDAKPETPVRCCLHVQVRHEHGTRAAYVLDRCRCAPCTAANTVQARRRNIAIAYGTWPGLVDQWAEIVQEYLHRIGLASRGDDTAVRWVAVRQAGYMWWRPSPGRTAGECGRATTSTAPARPAGRSRPATAYVPRARRTGPEHRR